VAVWGDEDESRKGTSYEAALPSVEADPPPFPPLPRGGAACNEPSVLMRATAA